MIIAKNLIDDYIYLSNTHYTFKNYLYECSFLASLRVNKIKLSEEAEKQ